MGNQGSQSTLEVGQGEGRLDNDLKVRWRRIDRSEGPLNGRDCHCAAGAANGLLYVFGGVVVAPNGGHEESSDLLVFNPETESWNVVAVKGDVPPPRTSASFAAVGDKLYLFGGLSQARGWMNSVFMFNTVTSTWTELNASGSAPSPRDKLATATVGCKIYVFGGFGPKSKENEANAEDEEDDEDDEESDGGGNNSLEETQEAAEFGWFDDLFVFDTDSLCWSQPMHLNKGGPTPRAAHAMCATSNHLVIFGGRDTVGRTNDLYIYDTESRKWVHDLQVTGLRPEPRSFHTACTVGHRVIVIGGRGINNQHFGDVHVLDTETWQWLQPSVEGDLLTPRGVHTAAVVGNRLVVFGGSSDFDAETMQCDTYLGDTYVLDADDLLKGKASSTNPPPENELGNPSTSVQEQSSTSS